MYIYRGCSADGSEPVTLWPNTMNMLANELVA